MIVTGTPQNHEYPRLGKSDTCPITTPPTCATWIKPARRRDNNPPTRDAKKRVHRHWARCVARRRRDVEKRREGKKAPTRRAPRLLVAPLQVREDLLLHRAHGVGALSCLVLLQQMPARNVRSAPLSSEVKICSRTSTSTSAEKIRRDAPVYFPERVAPPESAQKPLGVGVEPGYVEGRGEGLDAVQSPWFTVVHRICCDEVRHCYKLSVSTNLSLWNG